MLIYAKFSGKNFAYMLILLICAKGCNSFLLELLLLNVTFYDMKRVRK